MTGQFTTREEVAAVYQKRAWVYDSAVYYYYLVGMRIGHWRRLAMDALRLGAGTPSSRLAVALASTLP